jgi:hypothetical protein
VPVSQIAALASEQARLAAILGVLMTRLLSSQSAATDESVDQLLTAEEVARALGVTRRWVQRLARRLPLARRLSETPFAIPIGAEALDGQSPDAGCVGACEWGKALRALLADSKFVRVHPDSLAVAVDHERQPVLLVLKDRLTARPTERLVNEVALCTAYRSVS